MKDTIYFLRITKWNMLKLETNKLVLTMGNTTVKRSKSSDSMPDSVHPFDCVPDTESVITKEKDIKEYINNFVDGKLIVTRNYTPQYEQFHKRDSLVFDFNDESCTHNTITKEDSTKCDCDNIPQERMNMQYNSIFEEIKKKYIPNSKKRDIPISVVYDENDTIVQIAKDEHVQSTKKNEKKKKSGDKGKTMSKLKRTKPSELKVYKPVAIYAIDDSYTSESSSTESSKRNSISQLSNCSNDLDIIEIKMEGTEKTRNLDISKQSGEDMDTTIEKKTVYPLQKIQQGKCTKIRSTERESKVEYPLSIIDYINYCTKSDKRGQCVDDLLDKPVSESSSSDEICYNPFEEEHSIDTTTWARIEQLNNYSIRLKKLYIEIREQQPDNFNLLKDIEKIINNLMTSIKELTVLCYSPDIDE